MNAPLVSIIVVNWNGRHLLPECLASLEAQNYRNYEIIVVDNGSDDGSIPWLQEKWGNRLRLIPLPCNTGFAHGNNVGIRAAGGAWVALVNNDVVVSQDWLASLVSCGQEHPEAGMIGSKVLNYYRPDEIDNVGHLIYDDAMNRGWGRLEQDRGQYNEITEIFCPSACATLYRKAMLVEAGLFDAAFFAYHDDVDIGLRGRLLGYAALYCPRALAYHKFSQSTGAYSPLKAFLVERNRLWVLLKIFPWANILASPWYTGKRYLFQMIGILKRQGAAARLTQAAGLPTVLRITLQAYRSALAGVPQVLQKRRRLNLVRRVDARQFRRWLRQYPVPVRDLAFKDLIRS